MGGCKCPRHEKLIGRDTTKSGRTREMKITNGLQVGEQVNQRAWLGEGQNFF